MNSNRQSYLDWLRIGCIAGVLLFHSAMPFTAEWDWHIKNADRSGILMEICFFLSRFRMPLLFFISGAITYYMLMNRSCVDFLRLRFKRLFIPLLAGMAILVPVQVYLERLNHGYEGNFWDFYPTVFTTGFYPNGNLSWHHLWFIAYLIVYDTIFAPLFKLIHIRPRIFGFLSWFAPQRRIYLTMIPSVILFSLLVRRFPQTNLLINDWNWLIYWASFLLAGYFFLASQKLLESLERLRRSSLLFAMITFVVIEYLRWNSLEPGQNSNQAIGFLYVTLYPITAWLWVFSIIGYGKKYLHRKSNLLTYLNRAAYPFYILHQTIIVIIAFYAVKTTDSVLLKFAFIAVTSACISILLYHLLISRIRFLSFIFGLATAKQSKSGFTSKQSE